MGDSFSDYVVLDIETTGLSKYYHKITEIAAIKVSSHEITDRFHSLINPGVRIPRFITRLTGINDKMVRDSPRIEEVLPDFQNFLRDEVLIAHNATFDHGFLHKNFHKNDLSFKNQRLCTRKLANRLLPDLRSKKLSSLCQHFEIENLQEHRAMTDVIATYRVFCNFLLKMNDLGVKTREDVMRFERTPPWRLRKSLLLQTEK